MLDAVLHDRQLYLFHCIFILKHVEEGNLFINFVNHHREHDIFRIVHFCKHLRMVLQQFSFDQEVEVGKEAFVHLDVLVALVKRNWVVVELVENLG